MSKSPSIADQLITVDNKMIRPRLSLFAVQVDKNHTAGDNTHWHHHWTPSHLNKKSTVNMEQQEQWTADYQQQQQRSVVMSAVVERTDESSAADNGICDNLLEDAGKGANVCTANGVCDSNSRVQLIVEAAIRYIIFDTLFHTFLLSIWDRDKFISVVIIYYFVLLIFLS